VGPGAVGVQMWEHTSYGDVIFVTSNSWRSAYSYIRFRGEELCSNQPTINERFLLASEAASWKGGTSLLQVISSDFYFCQR
jgi:hypothetical protein